MVRNSWLGWPADAAPGGQLAAVPGLDAAALAESSSCAVDGYLDPDPAGDLAMVEPASPAAQYRRQGGDQYIARRIARGDRRVFVIERDLARARNGRGDFGAPRSWGPRRVPALWLVPLAELLRAVLAAMRTAAAAASRPSVPRALERVLSGLVLVLCSRPSMAPPVLALAPSTGPPG